MGLADVDAVVVGGGLVGKAGALALARAGLRVLLCGAHDAAAAPATGYAQRVYAFNAASCRLLERLRVWPQVPAGRVQPVAGMHIVADGAALDFDAAAQRVEALAWIAESDAVERALDLALRFEHGVRVMPAAALEALREGGLWRLRLDDGTQLACALLVGADGRDSRVRRWAGIGMRAKPYGQSGVVCNLRCAGAHGGIAFQGFDAQGVLALLPLPACDGADQVSIVWSAPDELAAELRRDGELALAERVQARLDELGAQRLGALQPAGSLGTWPLVRQRALSLAGEGVALLGDAGHVVHPLAGHGLNLGLQDVQALAAVLGARAPGEAPDDGRVLRRYARARAEQVLALETATDGLLRLYAPTFGWLAPLRAAGLRATNHLPPVKSWLASYASGLSVIS